MMIPSAISERDRGTDIGRIGAQDEPGICLLLFSLARIREVNVEHLIRIAATAAVKCQHAPWDEAADSYFDCAILKLSEPETI